MPTSVVRASQSLRVTPLDLPFALNNNGIGFARSSRRHRIGRARVLAVLAASPLVDITTEGHVRPRVLAVGSDWTGRLLEVVAVVEDDRLVVIHAMDARPKLIRMYAERMRDGAP